MFPNRSEISPEPVSSFQGAVGCPLISTEPEPVSAFTAPWTFSSLISPDPVPATPAAEQILIASDRAYATACARSTGALLGHVGTLDVARDLEELRMALGDLAVQRCFLRRLKRDFKRRMMQAGQ